MTKALRALALGASLVPALAAAADDPTRRNFDPDPVRPALSLDGGYALETAAAAPRGRYGATFILGWTEGLLALQLGDERDFLLESRLYAHVMGAWSSAGWSSARTCRSRCTSSPTSACSSSRG